MVCYPVSYVVVAAAAWHAGDIGVVAVGNYTVVGGVAAAAAVVVGIWIVQVAVVEA